MRDNLKRVVVVMVAVGLGLTACNTNDPEPELEIEVRPVVVNPIPVDTTATPVDSVVTPVDTLVEVPEVPEEPKEPLDTAAHVFAMHITLSGGLGSIGKEEYVSCSVRVAGDSIYEDYESDAMEQDAVKGRGNSTWSWYPKKPYKLKLAKKQSLLGMGKGKKYVLLANYRDPTGLMNAVTFDMAEYLGMPYTCTVRFVNLYVNEKYLGVYQITEQIERAKDRVGVAKDGGVLLALDLDDGPGGDSDEGNNFLSEVFGSSYSPKGLPVCVKYPEEMTSAELVTLRSEFAKVERCVKKRDYAGLKKLVDVKSMMDFLIIQEMTRNVELVTPRSMYMHRDAGGLWTFGPVWDFDGGYAYDWGENHGYFGSQSWLMGPKGAYDIPDLFDGMFGDKDFLADYKTRWGEIRAGLWSHVSGRIDAYRTEMSGDMAREASVWPKGKSFGSESVKMRSWLERRMALYDEYLRSW